MTEIAIKIEQLKDDNMIVNFYNYDTTKLKDVDPLDELKVIETLIKARKIFEDTPLHDIINKQLQYRIGRLLAIFSEER